MAGQLHRVNIPSYSLEASLPAKPSSSSFPNVGSGNGEENTEKSDKSDLESGEPGTGTKVGSDRSTEASTGVPFPSPIGASSVVANPGSQGSSAPPKKSAAIRANVGQISLASLLDHWVSQSLLGLALVVTLLLPDLWVIFNPAEDHDIIMNLILVFFFAVFTIEIIVT